MRNANNIGTAENRIFLYFGRCDESHAAFFIAPPNAEEDSVSNRRYSR